MPKNKSSSRDPRIANIDLVEISAEGADKPRHEQIENVSRSGAFIRTKHPYPISTQVKMVFTLVAETRQCGKGKPLFCQVRVKGEVVRIVRSEYEPGATSIGMGIKFIDLDPKATQLIDEIVDQHLENTADQL